ncbi:esterase-like activity of phytase family protein [Sphingomonas profundi]|uniref:esterase-like activity of phytase family protein n=1 Tax=Alterirhizorhabdus profundi TaxID=2681549 RepID=UPI0012E8BD33|nr:esterase-like activity of phytase family protein [Sphingomonas profundi]
MRSICLSIVGLCLLVVLASASAPLSSPAIRATAVALDRADPARVRVGRLRYLGGWELASSDSRFGGLSAMVWNDGRLLATSDAGTLFDIGFARGVPMGRVRGPLPAGPGDGLGKSDRDAESMTRDPATGRIWIGFEYHNAVWRYDAGAVRAQAHAEPAAMRGWPQNEGPEAMVRLRDGRFLIFSEGGAGPERSTALLLFGHDPVEAGPPPILAGYRAPAGYKVTDATELPDGRLLLLHRRVSLMQGLTAIVGLFDPATIRAGHASAAVEIAQLVPPLTVDNMEAMAVSREGGRLILWIASDDNFSPLQRTLLMKFALPADLGPEHPDR